MDMKTINIVMITDNNYVNPTVVAITSVLKNKTSDVKIYVLANNLKRENICLLESYDNVEIIDAQKYIENYKNIDINRHVSYSALLKFYIPEIFQHLDKILYLDSDIIVQKDLAELFNTNIENYYAAVVKDTLGILNKEHLNTICTNASYFNSGVMLLNLSKMRNDNIRKKLLDYRLTKENKFMDQDAFNVVIGHCVKYISYKYNFLNYYLEVMSIKDLSEKLFDENLPKTQTDIYKSCVIIHLGGAEKPWQYKFEYLSDLYEYYWKISYISEPMPMLLNRRGCFKIVTPTLLNDIIGNKKVVFWGASLFLEKFITENSYKNKNVLGIVDKNTLRQGKFFGEFEIFSPLELIDLKPDAILMTIANNNRKIYNELKEEFQKKYPAIELLPNIFEIELKEKCSKIDILAKSNPLEIKLEKYKTDTDKQYTELLNAQIFNNLINNSTWVQRKDFIPTGGAATYSFLKILYVILEYIQPINILEFGMGQTSKLTAQYKAYKNPEANLQIIEHDKDWIDYFSQQLPHNTNIIRKDIVKFEFNGTVNEKYNDLSNITKNHKYSLIIIDGPYGYNSLYSRTNIIDLIPDNLADDFIIILDDYDRIGERNTGKLILDKLDECNIKYYKKSSIATKTQLIITSESYKFITFY